MLQRIQAQAHGVDRFSLELRIVADHVRFQPKRFRVGRGPESARKRQVVEPGVNWPILFTGSRTAE